MQPPPGGGPPWQAPGPYAPPPAGGGPPWQPPPNPYLSPPQSQGASTQAVVALVLAILGWLGCGCLLSVPAIFVAHAELGAIERGEASPAGKGIAQAAFWVAIANVVILFLVICAYTAVGFIAFMAKH